MTASGIQPIARTAYGVSLCALPPKEDGSKRPDIASWTQDEHERSTEAEILRWYGRGEDDCSLSGVGLVFGEVSGDLELLEFDDHDTSIEFKRAADALGLADIVERIERGYYERTPGGGTHWLYPCDLIDVNTRLASRPVSEREVKVLIETRGEGGYVVIATSTAAGTERCGDETAK